LAQSNSSKNLFENN